VYSGQHEQTVQALVKDFEARTGAEVALRSGGEGELANQLLQEGNASPADVFYAENPPAISAVDAKKLLAPVDPATLGAVTQSVSSASGHWVGVTARSVALVFNTGKVTETALPASIMDLASPAWKGKLALAPSETDFQPVVTAVAKLKGVEAAASWLKGLRANAKIYADDEALVAAVDRGEETAGLLDHYYWFRLKDEAPGGKVHSELHYFQPGDAGALITISGAGVLASTKHPGLAQAFVAYLVSEPAQRIIAASKSWEYPLRPGVTAAAGLHQFASLTPAPLTNAELGDGSQALDLLKRVGLL
jgi:iron(III) transport system substrate-binding protein